jgi:transposase
MNRFVQCEERTQDTFLPSRLEDYVTDDNPVRVIDVFVAEPDLAKLGFEGMSPQATGRPGYHPSTLLKIYLYGYLNRILSSRRLERETQRNVELMWLTGRLMPDFKTIANFRKDNGPAIRGVCRQFIVLCRQLNLFTQAVVAVDGSKFKAVNNRDRNFTSAKVQRRMEQIEASINRYMSALDMADQEEAATAQSKSSKLKEKIAALKKRMQHLKEIEVLVQATPDKQISLTDPDARSMATSGKGTGVVGCNVQTVVDAQHHLIVAHDVTNVGNDRGQLATMAQQAQSTIGRKDLEVVADRGYFKGQEILACQNAGMMPFVPKPQTSGSKAEGRLSPSNPTARRCARAMWRDLSHRERWHWHGSSNSALGRRPKGAGSVSERRITRALRIRRLRSWTGKPSAGPCRFIPLRQGTLFTDSIQRFRVPALEFPA